MKFLKYRLHEADNGFVLIVDRRNDKWSSVKHVLFKFTVVNYLFIIFSLLRIFKLM